LTDYLDTVKVGEI